MSWSFTSPTTVDGTRNDDLGKQNYRNAAFDKYGQPFYVARNSPHLSHEYMEDFLGMKATVADGDKGINVIVTDNGSVTSANSATYPGGVVVLAASDTSAGDNDECYIGSEALNWTINTGKDLYFEARIKLTEASTNAANIVVGLIDENNANALEDDAGGPDDDYNGVGFYKVDGGTVWQFESAKSTSHATTASAGAFASGTWYRLGFYVDSEASITPYIDGVAGTPITTTASIPNDVALGWICGVKNGIAAAESLYVDYVRIVQLR